MKKQQTPTISLRTKCAVLGMCVGWATGILLAPYGGEQERFREYS